MAIKVTLTGRLADILDKELSLPFARTVGEAIIEVANMNAEAKAFLLDEEGKVRDNIIILVNDENVDDIEQPLREGDELFLLLPIAGG